MDIRRPKFSRKEPSNPNSPLTVLFIGSYSSEDVPRAMFHGVGNGDQEVRDFIFDPYRSPYYNRAPNAAMMMLGINCSKDDRQALLVGQDLFKKIWRSFSLADNAMDLYLNRVVLGLHLAKQDTDRLVFYLGGQEELTSSPAENTMRQIVLSQ